MIEAVIFDWDGVVVDSDLLQVESERHSAAVMAEELGVELDINAMNWKKFQGWSRKKIAAEIFRLTADDPLCDAYRLRVVDVTVDIMGKHNLWPIEGALTYINYLRARSCLRAVATSSNRRILDPSLRLFGLENEFHATVAHEECLDDKPLPGQYREIMRRLEVEPEHTLVIEDSAGGIDAARLAGALVLGLASTKSLEYLRSSTGAHMVAANYGHITHLTAPLLR